MVVNVVKHGGKTVTVGPTQIGVLIFLDAGLVASMGIQPTVSWLTRNKGQPVSRYSLGYQDTVIVCSKFV